VAEGDDPNEDQVETDADVVPFPSRAQDHPAAGSQESLGLTDSPMDTAERVAFADFTEDDYVQSTTREYQGLAEAIAEASKEDLAQSPVAAAIPGVSTGVVGFEDVTGGEAEDVELIDRVDRARRSDLALRVGTALALIAVFVGALAAGPVWITLFLAAIVIGAQGEFYAAVRGAGFSPVALVGLVGGAAVLAGAWASGPFAAAGFLGATVVATALWYAIVPRRYPLSNAGVTVFGVAWVAVPLSFAVPLFRAPRAFQIVLAMVLITAATDVAAYFFGRSLGRSKMAPVLSPNKTWEGYAGGILGATAIGATLGSFPFMEPLTVTIGVVLAVAIGVVSPLGDLAESVVKRLLGLKDMGSILPGHGGLLDRIDAFIVAVPIGYLTYLVLGIL